MHRAKILAAALLVTAVGATPALADEIDKAAANTSNEPVAVEVANTLTTVNEAAEPETANLAAEPVVEEAVVEEAAIEEGTSELAANEIENYVKRLYTVCLNRKESDIDKAGYDVQVKAMKNGTPAAQIAKNFFMSEEFANRKLTNEQIVETVYQTMFDNASDPEGMKLWKGYLDNHMSVAAVVKGFSESEQYKNNCDKWGVTAGEISVEEARDQDPKITEFAWGLYKEALGRADDACDIDGLNAQCQALLDGMNGSQIARNFFESAEYANRKLSNAEMVETVYETMLGRASDTDGAAFWKDYLDSGMSIDAVVCGFSQATEWVNHCDEAGIATEQLTPQNERDKNIDVTKFIQRLWNAALQRDPSATEVEERCKYLNDGRAAASMIVGVYESPEHVAKSMSTVDVIKGIFNVMVGTEASSTDISAWTGYLAENTAADMAAKVSKTNEFRNVCKKLGITAGYAHDPYDGAYQNITSTTNCFVLIDCNKNQLVIYEGSKDNWDATHIWSCATGAPGMDTVKGTYTITGLRGYYFDDAWGDRCFYYTQFYGDFLIHSVLYELDPEPTTIKDGTLGANVSHGCVRLDVENAKWIYDYVPTGSTVFIF